MLSASTVALHEGEIELLISGRLRALSFELFLQIIDLVLICILLQFEALIILFEVFDFQLKVIIDHFKIHILLGFAIQSPRLLCTFDSFRILQSEVPFYQLAVSLVYLIVDTLRFLQSVL